MKVVILAGGMGTRISEESIVRPKPMVEIGGVPILVHIMRHFSFFGHNEFIVCAGYKSQMIKEFFSNYYLHMAGAVTFDMKSNAVEWHGESRQAEPWTVTVVDTGLTTMTGGRLKRIQSFLGDGPFFMTYGDGVADVNLDAVVETFHQNDCDAVVTAVQPPGRFGRFSIVDGKITGFIEKPQGDVDWVNGGYFVLDPAVLDYIPGDATQWEVEPMQDLAAKGRLMPYFHKGFWQPMDTLREKTLLEGIWAEGNAPWKHD